ncbi:MAG: glycosyltransferase [Burkholderiales bacterium]|nr:glycosyltransferase [Burkholderiales bacterium]MBY0245754.1 glycosyltransferase [Sphingobacteriaceae bacterium]
MNIVIIPSWYPSKTNSLSGIFFREQASLFAAKYRNCMIHVLYVQNEPFKLSFDSTIKTSCNNNFHEHTLNTCQILPGRYSFFERVNNFFLKKKYETLFLSIINNYGSVDLIHVQSIYNRGSIAKYLSKKFGIPYIIQEHSSAISKGENNNFPQFYKNIFQDASSVFAVSGAAAQTLQLLIGKDVKVLPNFINDDRFSLTSNIRKSPFKFLCVSFLVEMKGIDMLIQAMSILIHKHNLCVELEIIGFGCEFNNLTNLCKELNLINHVKFLGSKSQVEISDYYKSCNCFVLPSRYETFGVVYLEALASGRPIIATRCGGPEDIVDEVNGILVDVDDVISLSKAMLKIMINFDSYDCNKIRLNYEQKFGSNSILQILYQSYLNNIKPKK